MSTTTHAAPGAEPSAAAIGDTVRLTTGSGRSDSNPPA